MAVEIDLDLDASGATGKIGAVAASLKGLERVANDIEIDFDADIGDITDEIEAFSDALEGINIDTDSLLTDFNEAVEKMEDAEVELGVSMPDGDTGSGDSVGDDPPDNLVTNLTELGGVSTQAQQAAQATDGGKRTNFFERTYGPDATLMSKSDIGDLFKTRNSRESNLGEHAASFPGVPHETMQVGTRTGFGLDPESMNLRRMADDISMEAFQKGADPTDKPLRRSYIPDIEDRLNKIRDLSISFEEAVTELDKRAKEASEDVGGWDFMDFNQKLRENLSSAERFDLSQQAEPSDKGFERKFKPDFDTELERRIHESGAITDSLEDIKKQQRQLFEDAGLDSDKVTSDEDNLISGRESYDFMDFNKEAREEAGLTFGELQNQTKAGGNVFDRDFSPPDRQNALGLDFSVGGGRNGRSDSDLIDNNKILSNVDSIRSVSDAFETLRDAQSGFGKKLRKLKPTMGKYMQLFAALIPVASVLAVNLLGVAAAMGSVAAAGAAIMGMGLLGHGKTMAGSMAQAKQEMRSLKREIFQAAQPTMQQFAPIQSRMFDAIPEALSGVFEKMEGLTTFKDTLFQLGAMLADGMEKAIEIILQNKAAIKDLTTTSARLIKSGLLKFFEWLIQAASKNKNLIISLGKDIIKLAVAVWNLFMAVSKVLTAFTPLFNILVLISQLLNSKIIIGLITMVSWLYVLGKAAGLIYGLYAGFMTLASGIADAALMMVGYEMSTWGAVAATLALVAAIGMLTLGAATVIGGAVTAGAMGTSNVPSGPGGGGGIGRGGSRGGGTTVYNDNRSYQINSDGGDDYASQKAMEDTVKKVNETKQAQSLPPVETSSESSDGNSTSN